MKNTKVLAKNAYGITLIALIITIIMLLILAGVAMSMLFGRDGIMTKANEAKMMHELTAIKEEIDLYSTGKRIEKKTGIELYPVLNETMASINPDTIPEGVKVKLLPLANNTPVRRCTNNQQYRLY